MWLGMDVDLSNLQYRKGGKAKQETGRFMSWVAQEYTNQQFFGGGGESFNYP